jgi:CheY-like chemotaxis protein
MPTRCSSLRAPAEQSCGTHKSRVLVVEDNVDICRLVTLLLQDCGFDVRALLNGHPVVPTALSFRPNFILLDIGLPDLDGYQVAGLLRNDPELRNIVIIAMSAYSPDMYQSRSHQAMFDHYLVKPVDFTSLLSLLNIGSP